MSRLFVAAIGLLASASMLAGCATNGGINRGNAATANANLGTHYLHKSENQQAQDAFRKALSYNPRNFTANWGMAIVSERLDKPAAARRYFKKALAIHSAPSVQNSYAAFLCEQGDTNAGLKHFERAAHAAKGATQADILANAGLCLYRAHRRKDAAAYFRRSLKVNAKQFTALTRLARIEYDRSHYLSARAFIERADAAGKLNAAQLLLAARIELSLGDRKAAKGYLERYNQNQPSATRSLSQLESSRP